MEFSLKQDVEYLFENKNNLKEGIYVDREYPLEIEYERKVLRPHPKSSKEDSCHGKKSVNWKVQHYILKVVPIIFVHCTSFQRNLKYSK